jgi:hypothetical protein
MATDGQQQLVLGLGDPGRLGLLAAPGQEPPQAGLEREQALVVLLVPVHPWWNDPLPRTTIFYPRDGGLTMAVKRAFPWPKVVPYWAAQVLGAFVGGALVYLVYHDAISSFEAAKHITRGALGGAADSTPTFSIFATFPARDFGPRFFAWLAGWGQVAFRGPRLLLGPDRGPAGRRGDRRVRLRPVRGRRPARPGAPPAPDVDAFGETVEERPTVTDGKVGTRER